VFARLVDTVNMQISRYGKTSAVLAVVLSTAAFLPFRSMLGREQWGWPYLLVVGFIAGTAGIGPAVISAGLTFLAWNFFFIPPYHTFHVAESGDLLHLTAFLVVAVAVGTQTGRLREREERALKEESRTSALYDLSSRLVAETPAEEMAEMVDQQVRSVARVRGARLWIPTKDDSLSPVQGSDLPGLSDAEIECVREQLWNHDLAGAPCDDLAGGVFLPLATSSGVEGLLQVVVDETLQRDDLTFLTSVAHLVAAFLEGRRMADLAMRSAAAHEAERLRTALVSSVSHELKTPLASLTAAVTDLLERGDSTSPEEVQAILHGITADLDRLDRSIGDLLDLSRLEAQAWTPRPDEFEVGELVGAVASHLSDGARARISFDVPAGLPLAFADFVQTTRALEHVVDNALLYSKDDIVIGAHADGMGAAVIWVQDAGPGVDDTEKQQVFDKFYRGAAGRASKSSTGLGLSLTRQILHANGGSVWIENAAPHGARFVLRIPTAKEL
jgi:two-component system sensor histidine kinase KdpD